mmetsp:Transcript_19721/g.57219  ORF Transcript_19721/g.57219 Transcript_19721/m.57219 type:complete len:219 (-) Transcript_19721:895-1551(-)
MAATLVFMRLRAADPTIQDTLTAVRANTWGVRFDADFSTWARALQVLKPSCSWRSADSWFAPAARSPSRARSAPTTPFVTASEQSVTFNAASSASNWCLKTLLFLKSCESSARRSSAFVNSICVREDAKLSSMSLNTSRGSVASIFRLPSAICCGFCISCAAISLSRHNFLAESSSSHVCSLLLRSSPSCMIRVASVCCCWASKSTARVFCCAASSSC